MGVQYSWRRIHTHIHVHGTHLKVLPSRLPLSRLLFIAPQQRQHAAHNLAHLRRGVGVAAQLSNQLVHVDAPHLRRK